MSRLQDRWIGKKNLRGYLKFWYYKRRGWVYGDDQYYVKGLKRGSLQ